MKREADGVELTPGRLQEIARELYRLADRWEAGEMHLVSGWAKFDGLRLSADAVFAEGKPSDDGSS